MWKLDECKNPWQECNDNIFEGKIGRKGNNWFFWAIKETGIEDILKFAKSGENWCDRSHGAIKNTSRFVWSDGYNNATSQFL